MKFLCVVAVLLSAAGLTVSATGAPVKSATNPAANKSPIPQSAVTGHQTLEEQLIHAAFSGDADKVRVLLKKGVDPNAAKGGLTPLMVAASRGHVPVLRLLLAAGAQVNAQDRAHVTALMLAALQSSAEDVDLLLQSGADINAKTTSGQTAVMFAAGLAKADVVRSLLRGKPDLRVQDEDGWTALTWAELNNDLQIPGLLKRAGAPPGPAQFVPDELITAAYEGDAPTVRRLMKSVLLNATDHAGHTALVAASENGQVEIVKLLLAAGANPNVTDNLRPTGLGMIVSEGVVLAGIDEVVETKRQQGVTPLQFAARFGHAEVVKTLLAAGAKIEGGSPEHGPLLLAVHAEEPAEVVRLLLDAGAEVNVQGKDGMTPLMIVALSGDAASLRLLLEHGADTQLKDKDGNTAFWWGRDKEEIVALLKQAQEKKTK